MQEIKVFFKNGDVEDFLISNADFDFGDATLITSFEVKDNQGIISKSRMLKHKDVDKIQFPGYTIQFKD